MAQLTSDWPGSIQSPNSLAPCPHTECQRPVISEYTAGRSLLCFSLRSRGLTHTDTLAMTMHRGLLRRLVAVYHDINSPIRCRQLSHISDSRFTAEIYFIANFYCWSTTKCLLLTLCLVCNVMYCLLVYIFLTIYMLYTTGFYTNALDIFFYKL